MTKEKKSWWKALKSNPNLSVLKSFMQDLIDGNILVRKSFRRQYKLLLMVAIFCMIYIGNRYECDMKSRKQRELVKEIEDKRYELLSISAELTVKTIGSVVEDSVKARIPGLEIARVSSIKIDKEK